MMQRTLSNNERFISFKELLTLICLLLSMSCYSQESIIKLYASNDLGHTDTLIFGLKEGTQIGLDPQLGEVNYYGLPNDALDIRIRQRDSLNFSCGRIESLSTDVFWENNLDLKVDLRPYEGFDGFQNNTFEVNVWSKAYPVEIILDLSEIGFLDQNILETDKDDSCVEFAVFGTLGTTDGVMARRTVESGGNLFFSFESFDPLFYIVNNQDLQEPEFSFYPNPIKDNLFLENTGKSVVQIRDLQGRLKFEYQVEELGTQVINLAELPSGIYFLNSFDLEHKITKTKKIIKY